MDIVEARKKAKELKKKLPQEPAPLEQEMTQAEESKPGLEAPRKASSRKEKRTKPKKSEAKKPVEKSVKAKTKIPKAQEKAPIKPSQVSGEKLRAEKSKTAPQEPEAEFFVDTSFGEDLPELRAEKEKLIIEAKAEKKKPEPAKPISPPTAKISEKKKAEEKPVLITKPEPEQILGEEKEKDFYELVVEDLLQYGYAHPELEGDLVEFLSFQLGGEIYAVSLTKIQQIIKPRSVTLVPGAPFYIMGILSLRGMIIPVFDLRKRLRLAQTQSSRFNRIIIVQPKEQVLAGILVDRVLEVARIPAEEIEPPPAIFSGVEAQFLEGIARHKGQMLIVLDLARVILGREESETQKVA